MDNIIIVAKLKAGTVLLVETENNIYKIAIGKAGTIHVSGGQFPLEPTEALLIGSTTPEGDAYIGQGKPLEFAHHRNGKVIKTTTSPVKGCTIFGPQKNGKAKFYYDMWGNGKIFDPRELPTEEKI